MGLFKEKQKEFSIEDLNSPVLNKVMEFHAKNGKLAADFEKNQEKIKDLTVQLEQYREKYADSLSDEDLKQLVTTEGELNALKNVVKTQKELLDKGNKREYILSEDEKKSLKETFAPIRQKRDEITQKLTNQLAEVEKTLDELAEEQKVVHEAWGKIYGPLISASQENWMIGNDLVRQREASIAQVKIANLETHKALDIHGWHR